MCHNTANVCNCCRQGGKTHPRFTCLWPDEDMFEHEMKANWTLLCPLFSVNNVQSLRAAVETEENPARPTAWRRLMLQFAAQSFTYTDNLNNSPSSKWGHRIEKTTPSQKSGFPSSVSSQNSRVRRSCAPCCQFCDITVTLKFRVYRFMSSFERKACLTYASRTRRISETLIFTAVEKKPKQIWDAPAPRKISTPCAEAPLLQLSITFTRNRTSRIDHLWQDTKQKHHLMPWTTTQ